MSLKLDVWFGICLENFAVIGIGLRDRYVFGIIPIRQAEGHHQGKMLCLRPQVVALTLCADITVVRAFGMGDVEK